MDSHRYMEGLGSWTFLTCLVIYVINSFDQLPDKAGKGDDDLNNRWDWKTIQLPFRARPIFRGKLAVSFRDFLLNSHQSLAGCFTAGAMHRAVAIDFGRTAEIPGPRWRTNFDVSWRCRCLFFLGGAEMGKFRSVDVPLKKHTCLLSVDTDVTRNTSAIVLSCVCSNSY